MKYLIVFIGILLLGMDCEVERLDSLDNGIEYYPLQLPWVVLVDESVYDEDFGFDSAIVAEELFWFNVQASRDGVDREWFVMYELGDPEIFPDDDGTILIQVGYTGDDYEYDEDTSTSPIPGIYDFAYRDDELLYGTITISSDITYHEQTVRDVLKHELGHALGLAHDGCSEDLNSIMGECLIYDGELTQKDFESLI